MLNELWAELLTAKIQLAELPGKYFRGPTSVGADYQRKVGDLERLVNLQLSLISREAWNKESV